MHYSCLQCVPSLNTPVQRAELDTWLRQRYLLEPEAPGTSRGVVT